MTTWVRRIAWWLNRKSREDTLREELQFHLDEEARERREDGMTEEDATWAARRDLGNVTMLREDARAAWTWTWLEQLIQDVGFAVRMMWRSRMATAVIALTLALGIGANTAVFSFMDAILLGALPVPDRASLVVVKWHAKRVDFRRPTRESTFVLHSIDGQVYDEGEGSASRILPYPAFERLQQAAAPVMASFFAYHPAGRLNLVASGNADVAQGEYVSGTYFEGLRVALSAGRSIQSEDDRAGAPPVVVLSSGYANRHFRGAASAVGQPLLINNRPFTIVGVAPPEFYGVDPSVAPDVYLPLHIGEISPDPNNYWLEMMGRLRPGVDAARAQTVLAAAFDPWVAGTAMTESERRNLPRLRLDTGAGGLDTLRRRYSQPLYVLLTMVALILAIACANTANLLLARATLRRREMAVRLSVGAGRLRVVRQLLTESVCLACLGGGLSIPVALASMRLLTALVANGQESFTLHAELDWRVLLMTLGLSVGSGLLFGLAPALQSVRPSVMPALKDAGTKVIGSPRLRFPRFTLTQLLIVSQIAVSLLLLVAAGLFVRTLANLQSVELGFNAERVLLLDVNARQAGHPSDEITTFYDMLRRRFAALPGVTQVTLSHASLIRAGRSLPIFVGRTEARGARILNVGTDFFTTMGIQLLQGRAIDERDVPGRPAVAVVSELFARTFFDGQPAVGRHLTLDVPQTVTVAPALGASGPIDVEIVGVAAAARYGDLRDRTPPVVYLPYGQIPFPAIAQMTFALRTAAEPLSFTSSVRRVVHDADPQLPVTNVRAQTVEIDRTINQEILFARLCSAFAILALLIACVGLYGTMAYTVARRTNEIGLRMALGASSHGVGWMVLREVCVLAAIGTAISVPAALAASRFVQAFLFEVEPNDPGTFAAAVILLTFAALVAGSGPARRASRINPMTALRAE
jgi:macrolide transport system ATP-binding/permease protein